MRHPPTLSRDFLQINTAFIVCVCGLVLLFFCLKTTDWKNIDFCQNYISARRFLAHEIIYNPVLCLNVPLYASVQYPAHPPFSIFMFLPFALLPFQTGAIIWLYLSVGFYYLSGVLLLKTTKMFSRQNIFIFTLFSIFWNPLIVSNSVHNMAQVLFFLIVLSLFFYHRKMPVLSGIILGISALLKIWPLGIIVISLICKKTKLFISALTAYFIGNLLSLLIFGPQEHWRYLTRVLPNEKFFYPDPGNVSLSGFITRIFFGFKFYNMDPLVTKSSLQTGALIGEVVSVILFSSLTIFLYFLSRRLHHTHDDFIIFGITTPLILLTFPISWDWSAIILLLPVITLISTLYQFKPKSKYWWWLLALSLPAVCFPFWYYPYYIFNISYDHPILNTLISGWTTVFIGLFLFVLIRYLVLISQDFPPSSKHSLPLPDTSSHNS